MTHVHRPSRKLQNVVGPGPAFVEYPSNIEISAGVDGRWDLPLLVSGGADLKPIIQSGHALQHDLAFKIKDDEPIEMKYEGSKNGSIDNLDCHDCIVAITIQLQDQNDALSQEYQIFVKILPDAPSFATYPYSFSVTPGASADIILPFVTAGTKALDSTMFTFDPSIADYITFSDYGLQVLAYNGDAGIAESTLNQENVSVKITLTDESGDISKEYTFQFNIDAEPSFADFQSEIDLELGTAKSWQVSVPSGTGAALAQKSGGLLDTSYITCDATLDTDTYPITAEAPITLSYDAQIALGEEPIDSNIKFKVYDSAGANFRVFYQHVKLTSPAGQIIVVPPDINPVFTNTVLTTVEIIPGEPSFWTLPQYNVTADKILRIEFGGDSIYASLKVDDLLARKVEYDGSAGDCIDCEVTVTIKLIGTDETFSEVEQTISILAINPIFTNTVLATVEILPGEPSFWTLPDYSVSSDKISRIEFGGDSIYASLKIDDLLARKVEYDGSASDCIDCEVTVTIKLIGTDETFSEVEQTISILGINPIFTSTDLGMAVVRPGEPTFWTIPEYSVAVNKISRIEFGGDNIHQNFKVEDLVARKVEYDGQLSGDLTCTNCVVKVTIKLIGTDETFSEVEQTVSIVRQAPDFDSTTDFIWIQVGTAKLYDLPQFVPGTKTVLAASDVKVASSSIGRVLYFQENLQQFSYNGNEPSRIVGQGQNYATVTLTSLDDSSKTTERKLYFYFKDLPEFQSEINVQDTTVFEVPAAHNFRSSFSPVDIPPDSFSLNEDNTAISFVGDFSYFGSDSTLTYKYMNPAQVASTASTYYSYYLVYQQHWTSKKTPTNPPPKLVSYLQKHILLENGVAQSEAWTDSVSEYTQLKAGALTEGFELGSLSSVLTVREISAGNYAIDYNGSPVTDTESSYEVKINIESKVQPDASRQYVLQVRFKKAPSLKEVPGPIFVKNIDMTSQRHAFGFKPLINNGTAPFKKMTMTSKPTSEQASYEEQLNSIFTIANWEYIAMIPANTVYDEALYGMNVTYGVQLLNMHDMTSEEYDIFVIFKKTEPKFAQSLYAQYVRPFVEQSWTLPEIVKGTNDLHPTEHITINYGNLINCLDFVTETREFTWRYAADCDKSKLRGSIAMIITLKDNEGLFREITQTVQIQTVVNPSFSASLETIEVIPYIDKSWTLPTLVQGTNALRSPDPFATKLGIFDGCISYVHDTRVLTFRQDQCNEDPVQNTAQRIQIDIYDVYGFANDISPKQIVQLLVPSPPTFAESLTDVVQLQPGEEKTWTLPEVTKGSYEFHLDTLFTIDYSSLANCINFIKEDRTLTFRQENCDAQPSVIGSVEMRITLTDITDLYQVYIQNIEMLAPLPPSFAQASIPLAQVHPGIEKIWTLPAVVKGTYDLAPFDVLYEIVNVDLANYISFDPQSRQMTFIGNSIAMRTMIGETKQITITLKDKHDFTSQTYTMDVEILTPILPAFAEVLTRIQAKPGMEQKWTLPNVVRGTHRLVESSLFTIEFGQLKDYITFDLSSREMTFSQQSIALRPLVGSTLHVEIVLKDEYDFETLPIVMDIEIFEPILPKFLHEIDPVTLEAEKPMIWDLPVIDPGSFTILQVKFDPGAVLEQFLVFDEEKRQVSFDGSKKVRDYALQQIEVTVSLVYTETEQLDYKYNVTMEGCPILTKDLEVLSSIIDKPLAISSLIGEGKWDQIYYKSEYAKIEKALGFNDEILDLCGNMTVEFVTKNDFLKHDQKFKSITLLADEDDMEDGVFDKSYLQFSLASHSWKIPVHATLSYCTIKELSFEKPLIKMKYLIGSGIQEETLPKVIQVPDCEKQFNILKLKSTQSELSQELLAKAMTLDLELGSITVATDDFLLSGAQATLTIEVDQDSVAEAETLMVEITFEAPKPEFDKQNFSVDPLTCSKTDASWAFQLPEFSDATLAAGPVEIVFLTDGEGSDLFIFSDGEIKLSPQQAVKQSLGQQCPAVDEITLEFNLISKVLGENTQSIAIKVELEELSSEVVKSFNVTESQDSSFEGFVVGDDQGQKERNKIEVVEIEPLEVTKVRISPTGELTIRFNKPILKPRVKGHSHSNEKTNETKERKLQELPEVDITDAVKVFIKGDEDEQLDKSIADISFEQTSDTLITIGVNFKDVSSITKDIKEPDILVIELILPQLFKDAETDEPLSEDTIRKELLIGPQFTNAQFEQLKAQAEGAAKMGVAASIWEIVILFSLNKALFSMWILIHVLQFYVYLSMWMSQYPAETRFLLMELRKIALGEFMDDLEISNVFNEAMGFEVDQGGGAEEEKLGDDRLGTASIFSSFGATMVIGSIAFVLIIGIILLLIYCRKRVKLSEKNKQRIQNLRYKVFWNAIIRYLFLNSLKLNMSAFVVLKASKVTGGLDIAVAVLMVLALNSVPIVLSRLLYLSEDKFEDEVFRKKFGTLYQGKNVSQDRKHRIYLFPLAFFYRRTLFIIATVFLFDYPSMQMVVHQVLTMGFVVYLVYDKGMFASKSQRLIEGGSEFLMHCSSMILQQFMTSTNDDPLTQEIMQGFFLAIFALLVTMNLSYVGYVSVQNCKDKKRLKLIVQNKKTYDEKVEELRVQKENSILLQQEKMIAVKLSNKKKKNEPVRVDVQAALREYGDRAAEWSEDSFSKDLSVVVEDQNDDHLSEAAKESGRKKLLEDVADFANQPAAGHFDDSWSEESVQVVPILGSSEEDRKNVVGDVAEADFVELTATKKSEQFDDLLFEIEQIVGFDQSDQIPEQDQIPDPDSQVEDNKVDEHDSQGLEIVEEVKEAEEGADELEGQEGQEEDLTGQLDESQAVVAIVVKQTSEDPMVENENENEN